MTRANATVTADQIFTTPTSLDVYNFRANWPRDRVATHHPNGRVRHRLGKYFPCTRRPRCDSVNISARKYWNATLYPRVCVYIYTCTCVSARPSYFLPFAPSLSHLSLARRVDSIVSDESIIGGVSWFFHYANPRTNLNSIQCLIIWYY